MLVEDGVGALVELTCETDFVAKGADFTGTVAALARLAVDEGEEELAEPAVRGRDGRRARDPARARSSARTIELGRVVGYETTDGVLDGYKHIQNERGTIGVLVELGGVDPGEREGPGGRPRPRAPHRAAPRRATSRATTSPRTSSRRSARCSTSSRRNEGKPENAIAKIVEGRLNGFYKDYVLLEQGFVRDPKTTIGKLVEGLGGGATVRRFARVKIGEE